MLSFALVCYGQTTTHVSGCDISETVTKFPASPLIFNDRKLRNITADPWLRNGDQRRLFDHCLFGSRKLDMKGKSSPLYTMAMSVGIIKLRSVSRDELPIDHLSLWSNLRASITCSASTALSVRGPISNSERITGNQADILTPITIRYSGGDNKGGNLH